MIGTAGDRSDLLSAALRWLLDRRSSPRLELRLALPFLALAAALGVATWQAPNPHVAFWGPGSAGRVW